MEQRSEEWFRARLGHVTGSRMTDVLAKIKNGEASVRSNYKLQLVTERLTDEPVKSFSNSIMQQGIDREPEARELYELEYGPVQEVGFEHHPTIAWCGVSVDGLTEDNGIIEIKCPLETTHTSTLINKKVPSKYIPQIQWGLCVYKRDYCDFVSYNPSFPNDLKLYVHRVERDDDYIKMLEEEVQLFNAEVEEILIKLKENNNG